MSNNRSSPGPSSLPFLVAEYENEKAVIGRNKNYQETLVSLKKAFSALRNKEDEDIIIKAHVEEVDDSCRIIDEMWPELLPRLTIVQVTLDPLTQPSKPEKQLSEHIQLEEKNETRATIHVHCRLGFNWGNPVTQIYTTKIALDSTFRQLAEQLKLQDNLTFTRINYRYGSASAGDGSLLAQLGVRSGSVVEITFD